MNRGLPGAVAEALAAQREDDVCPLRAARVRFFAVVRDVLADAIDEGQQQPQGQHHWPNHQKGHSTTTKISRSQPIMIQRRRTLGSSFITAHQESTSNTARLSQLEPTGLPRRRGSSGVGRWAA